MGPDRIFGFSPIPAMSMINYAAGSRYLSLIGGVCLRFYDWYCDLPPLSPQIWGEQTDVPESADWYNSAYLIITWGQPADDPTPTPLRFTEGALQGRQDGGGDARTTPNHVKFADLWMPVKRAPTPPLAMAMGHVILKEFYVDKRSAYFDDYARQYATCRCS